MKIKHWQGYGCVNASIIFRAKLRNKNNKIVKGIKIRVTGNHEYGLKMDMNTGHYWIVRWLGKLGKFTEQEIDYVICEEGIVYNEIKKIDEDYCIYTIFLKENLC